MRVLLINPAERDVLPANLPREIEAVRGANPPISLLQVAAAARAWGGADVHLVDAHASGFSAARVAEKAAALTRGQNKLPQGEGLVVRGNSCVTTHCYGRRGVWQIVLKRRSVSAAW